MMTRITPYLRTSNLIAAHREKHGTIEQVNRITSEYELLSITNGNIVQHCSKWKQYFPKITNNYAYMSKDTIIIQTYIYTFHKWILYLIQLLSSSFLISLISSTVSRRLSCVVVFVALGIDAGKEWESRAQVRGTEGGRGSDSWSR